MDDNGVPAGRLHQWVLITSTVIGSWLGMQAFHELGHVIMAWITGGQVARVVLNPFDFSRTDLSVNPHPLLDVWGGPVIGSLLPVLLWAAGSRWHEAYLLRFLAGFCLIANGAYIALGSFDRLADAGDMQRYDSPIWLLWLFGLLTIPAGLWLWHRQGQHFGLGPVHASTDRKTAYLLLAAYCLGNIYVLGLPGVR